MDGARLFNAATALGVPVAQITQHADSVTFCLSKVMNSKGKLSLQPSVARYTRDPPHHHGEDCGLTEPPRAGNWAYSKGHSPVILYQFKKLEDVFTSMETQK